MNIDQRLTLILEAANYCRKVNDMGMPRSAFSKSLREPIHFLWEKRKSPNKEKAAEFRSVQSVGLKLGERKLVYDHAVPFKIVMEKILAAKELTLPILRDILEKHIVTCIITEQENKMLNKAGLGHKMPDDWDRSDSLARYKAVGINIVGEALL